LMERTDLHIHTTYSDGKSTPEQMIRAAIACGLTEIGFSDHSHTAFDTGWCMAADAVPRYREEILALKEKYRDQISVLCGIEQDYYSETPAVGFDYVIGSVHYLKADGVYIPVDETAEILQTEAEKHFGGDIYALAEEYYRAVSDVVRKTGAGIIGHFDLITKFQEKSPIFDTSHPRYVSAWKQAADALLKTGAVFEINHGAVLREYRTGPYPAPEILAYLRERGAKTIITTDSHSESALLRFHHKQA